MNIQNYWSRVREIEKQLPGPPTETYITSLEDPSSHLVGGVVTACDRLTAAKFIARGSHRLSTGEEVSAALEADAKHREDVRLREVALKQQYMTISNLDQFQQLLAGAVTAAGKATKDSK